MATQRYYRKIIRIRAEDSPNVRLALAQRSAGQPVTHEMLVPGVLTWDDYCKRRATWDKVRQCIGLDGDFYEGASILMYPPDWLNRAEEIDFQLKGRHRKAKGIGIDPAEGGDKTSMCAVDELGIIELTSKQTPDTRVVTTEAMAFMRKHNVPPECVVFDRGGGGKEHVDRLRDYGMEVRSVGFGETLVLDPKRGLRLIEDKIDMREEHYVYFNRRAQMYGELRLLLDPSRLNDKGQSVGFGIPDGSRIDTDPVYKILRQELAPIPLLYDPEGRMRMLPKNKKKPDSEEPTLVELIGFSPDEADSLVLAVHGLLHEKRSAVAGAIR